MRASWEKAWRESGEHSTSLSGLTGAKKGGAGGWALPGSRVGIPHGQTIHVEVGGDPTGLDCHQVSSHTWKINIIIVVIYHVLQDITGYRIVGTMYSRVREEHCHVVPTSNSLNLIKEKFWRFKTSHHWWQEWRQPCQQSLDWWRSCRGSDLQH